MDSKESSKAIKKVLDTSSLSQSLWLVKIPQIVYDRWSQKNDGDNLGSLNIGSLDGNGLKKVVIKLNNEGNHNNDGTSEENAHNMINEYVVDELSSSLQLVPFLQNEDNQTFSIKGSITKHCTLKPRGDEKYREFLRDRTANASKRERTTKELDPEAMQLGVAPSRSVDFIPPVSSEGKRRGSEMRNAPGKRRKEDIDMKDLRSTMFQAFEKSNTLTMKELTTFCQTAEKDLKPLLRDYAMFHSKGELRNFWELKQEFRNQSVGNVSIPQIDK